MSKIIRFIKSEPVIILAGLVNAGIELAVELGLHLTAGQRVAILTFSLAIVSVVTRQQVTPVDKGDGSGA